MNQDQEMAEHCFGYGRWSAPFWFIGPEQGMSNDASESAYRSVAWRDGGSLELDDCIDYHRRLEALRPPPLNKWGKRKDDWHSESASPQKTWSRLINFLSGFRAGEVLGYLEYQRIHWGTLAGQTCVAELSGIAAHHQAVKGDRKEFLPIRLKTMSEALNGKQDFVLVYGRTPACQTAWEYFTRDGAIVGHCANGAIVCRKGNALFVQARFHPAGNGQPYEAWRRFGQEVQNLQQLLQIPAG